LKYIDFYRFFCLLFQKFIKRKNKGLTSLLEAQKWKKIKNQSGFEQTDFQYRCSGWKEERRFTAIRQIEEEIDTKETLFAGTPKIEYNYFCYVSNMKSTPWSRHKYYGKRATSENWIEWCKNQMASGSILTQDFWANSAIFQNFSLHEQIQVDYQYRNIISSSRNSAGKLTF
jgi:hypothetical protein